MDKKNPEFTVGELAKSTGLTVRTLQHYDNIGLLPASGRTEGGRRFYTESDMIKLEQIVFYKSLGISLNEINKKLIASPSLSELDKLLCVHETVLVKKIESLQNAVSILNTSLGVIRRGQYPCFEELVELIHIMNSGSMDDWTSYKFDSRITQNFNQGNMNTADVMDIYQTMKSIQIEAITLNNTGKNPDSLEAQDVAKNWWELVMRMTNGDTSMIESLGVVNQNRESWPSADRKLYETAEPFINAALAVYMENNDIARDKDE